MYVLVLYKRQEHTSIADLGQELASIAVIQQIDDLAP
jgi:hypothetical protein